MIKDGETAGRSDANAINVQYWCRMAYWSPAEIEWLILGIDPDRVCDEDFDQRPYKEQRDSIRQKFDRRTRQTNRHPAPREALKIAEDIGEAFPPELVTAVESASVRAASGEAEPPAVQSARAQDVTALKRRVKTLQKLILVMAATKYDWDLSREAAPANVKALQDAFEEMGLNIDQATIREHLADVARSLNAAEQQVIRTYWGDD